MLMSRGQTRDERLVELNDQWVEVFGATELEIREQMSSIVLSYRRLLWSCPWNVIKRHRLVDEYIRLECIQTIGIGLTTEWR